MTTNTFRTGIRFIAYASKKVSASFLFSHSSSRWFYPLLFSIGGFALNHYFVNFLNIFYIYIYFIIKNCTWCLKHVVKLYYIDIGRSFINETVPTFLEIGVRSGPTIFLLFAKFQTYMLRSSSSHQMVKKNRCLC